MLAMNEEIERARLIGVMDDYLSAFARRDFRALRFAANLKNTDNGIALPVGSGLARTVRAVRDGGQYFADPAQGQVEFWGVADELGCDIIFGVRLKVEGALISEIETLGVRNTDPYYFPPVILQPDPSFHDLVDQRDRCSREELIHLANRYFDGIEQNDGALVSVRADCQRLVNGAEDTLTDISELDEGDAHRALSVQDQMTGGHYAYIEGLRSRRYPIVDEKRGIVVAHLLFDHPGDIPKPNGDKVFGRPNSMIAFEAFKASKGEISAVWAVCYTTTYGSPSGW